MAGVACGNEDNGREFSGIAPLAGIAVVKCKQAKQNLRDFYGITADVPCFMETDIMLGIRYLISVAYYAKMPMVICLGVGTNMGSHYRGGVLGDLMQSYGDQRGLIMVAAGGNEGNSSHHYRSEVVEGRGDVEVELRVDGNEKGFTAEIWCGSPGLCSVALISPSGEYSGRTYARVGERSQIRFLLENTVVNIEYILVSFESGDECIRLRFRNPEEGIWRVRVFNETDFAMQFDMWLPMRNFLQEGTYFLRPDSNITLCEPSNNVRIITSTYYNGETRGIAIESSKGYNRKGEIRPDIAAPGVQIYGPLPYQGNVFLEDEQERLAQARYGYRTGSSAAAAVTAGASILMAEWGFWRRNDINMNTSGVQKYLIRGANRTGRSFPNEEWGYGTLDLYGVFEQLRITDSE